MAYVFPIRPSRFQPAIQTIRVTPTLVFVARLALALIFVLSGLSKLDDIPGTAAFIASAGIPLPWVAAIACAMFEFCAGLLLIIGWHARAAAALLALFTLMVSFIFHAFWSVPPELQFVHQLMFMKNLSIAGGLLLVAAQGAGAASIDCWERSSHKHR